MKTQSAKICLNFNFRGGCTLPSQNSKCQDLSKFQFLGVGGMVGGGRGCTLPSQNWNCDDLPKFQFFWGGILCKVKTQSAKIYLNFNWGGVLCQVKTQSAKICLNFNFFGRGGTLPSQNSKCQDLPKVQFLGGGEECTLPSQNSKCQDLPKFQFFWGGLLCQVKTQSTKICLNFNFSRGVYSAKSKLKVPRSA